MFLECAAEPVSVVALELSKVVLVGSVEVPGPAGVAGLEVGAPQTVRIGPAFLFVLHYVRAAHLFSLLLLDHEEVHVERALIEVGGGDEGVFLGGSESIGVGRGGELVGLGGGVTIQRHVVAAVGDWLDLFTEVLQRLAFLLSLGIFNENIRLLLSLLQRGLPFVKVLHIKFCAIRETMVVNAVQVVL